MTQPQTAVLSTKGQVVIPADLRAALGLSEGDRLAFVIDGQRLVVERVPSRMERRRARMVLAFADYAKSDVEKVWASIDGEGFVDD